MQANNRFVILGIGLLIAALALIAWYLLSSQSQSNRMHDALDKEEVAAIVSEAYAGDTKEYIDPQLHFTFTYPSMYTIGAFAEEESRIVLLQENEKGVGLQIRISTFDEDIQKLTESRIKQDLPNLLMQSVRDISVNGVPALSFISSGGGFGESIEAWFVHGGSLYQISTYAAQEALLEKVLASWKFE